MKTLLAILIAISLAGAQHSHSPVQTISVRDSVTNLAILTTWYVYDTSFNLVDNGITDAFGEITTYEWPDSYYLNVVGPTGYDDVTVSFVVYADLTWLPHSVMLDPK